MELGRRPRCCYTCLMYCQQGWLDNRQIGYLGISVESTGWCYNSHVLKRQICTYELHTFV